MTPISEIFSGINEQPNQANLNKDKINFCYAVFARTLKALESRTYAEFDGHTVNTSCHGRALLAGELIRNANKLNLKKWGRFSTHSPLDPHKKVPTILVSLSHFWILHRISKLDSNRGVLTDHHQLTKETGLNSAQAKSLIKRLQVQYANAVTAMYAPMSDAIPSVLIHGIPMKDWGRYVTPAYIVWNERKISFAPWLFSTLVTLGWLSAKNRLVAIITEVWSANKTTFRERLVILYRGSGDGSFVPLHSKAIDKLHHTEPVLVFGGCTESDIPIQKINQKIKRLGLTNITIIHSHYYPSYSIRSAHSNPSEDLQLTISRDSPEIDSAIKKRDMSGLSANDPSLFCPTHMFTLSCREVIGARGSSANQIPIVPIPRNFRQ